MSQAADYFKGEESNSSANKCMLKVTKLEGNLAFQWHDMSSFQVAQYAATLENYNKAIQIYEQVNDQLTSNIACIWESFLMSGGSLSTGV